LCIMVSRKAPDIFVVFCDLYFCERLQWFLVFGFWFVVASRPVKWMPQSFGMTGPIEWFFCLLDSILIRVD